MPFLCKNGRSDVFFGHILICGMPCFEPDGKYRERHETHKLTFQWPIRVVYIYYGIDERSGGNRKGKGWRMICRSGALQEMMPPDGR